MRKGRTHGHEGPIWSLKSHARARAHRLSHSITQFSSAPHARTGLRLPARRAPSAPLGSSLWVAAPTPLIPTRSPSSHLGRSFLRLQPISPAVAEPPRSHRRGPSGSQPTPPLGVPGNVVHSRERGAWALNAQAQARAQAQTREDPAAASRPPQPLGELRTSPTLVLSGLCQPLQPPQCWAAKGTRGCDPDA